MHASGRPGTWLRRVPALVGVIALSSLALAPTSALAADRPLTDLQNKIKEKLVTTADDTRSVGRCDFTAVTVDMENGVVTGVIGLGVRPKHLEYQYSNIYVEMECALYDADGQLLASESASAPGSRIMRYPTEVTVPISDGYALCGEVLTVTSTGQIHTGEGCDDSF